MSAIQEKTLNVEVSQIGKNRFGDKILAPEEIGVAFRGIDGFWVLSRGKAGMPDLQGTYRGTGRWPKAVGTVLRATLRANPTGEPGKWYHDILEVGPATGNAETWDFGGGTASPKPGASPFGKAAGTSEGDRNHSIERQVVLKAMAEVLAASIPVLASGGSDLVMLPKLAADFEARCNELWGEPAAAVADTRHVDPDEDDGYGDGLSDDSIPF